MIHFFSVLHRLLSFFPQSIFYTEILKQSLILIDTQPNANFLNTFFPSRNFFPLILIFEKKNYSFLKHNEVRKNSNEMKYISMWVYIKLNSLLAVLAWHQKWRFAYEIWHLSNGCYVCFLNINWLKTNFKTIVIFFRPQCAFIIFLTIYFTFIIKTN